MYVVKAGECTGGLCSAFVAGVTRGDSAVLAQLMHYPPDYDERRRAEDESGVADLIGVVLSDLGVPEEVSERTTAATYYGVGARPGGPCRSPHWSCVCSFPRTYHVWMNSDIHSRRQSISCGGDVGR